MSFRLREWKPNFPVDDKNRMNFSMMLIAKRRSGKSQLIKYLYEKYWKLRYDFVVIYTTLMNSKFYKDFIVGEHLIYTNNEVDRMKLIMDKNAKRAKTKKGRKNPINTLIIFDDTVSRKQRFDADIMDIYTKGRHYNMSIVYATQTPTLVDTVWRENSDLIMMFKMKTRRFQEYVADHVLNGILDVNFQTVKKEKNAYIDILKKATEEKYRCLVVDYVNDELFHFKANI